MKKMILGALVVGLLTSACGQKGNLYLPPPPPAPASVAAPVSTSF